MEVQTAQPPSCSSSAAGYPRWVMLEQYVKSNVQDSSRITPDAKTLAAARTSNGHRIQVSLGLAEPPATSALRVELPEGVYAKYATVVAADGDSLLLRVNLDQRSFASDDTLDHFVYNAGSAAADPSRPPSLSLLPSYNVTYRPMIQYLVTDATGILRHGDDQIVVAELHTATVRVTLETKAAELYMFRSGEWSIRRPRICSSVAGDGSLFGRASNRNLGVTAGGVLKFVNIFPRCCCGGAGTSKCEHSNHAYTIHTYTLRTEGMEWVMDGMVDATELWALEAYKGLPRVPLDYPIVSMDEPHVICFLLCEDHHVKYGDQTLWLLKVDTRSKTIQSVSKYPGGRFLGRALIPSSISYYLNSYPICSSDGTSTSLGQTSQMDIEKLRAYDSRNSMLQSSCKSFAKPAVEASEILAALQDIPSYGLDRDDMLKAYSILSNDNGLRLRSLLGLPLNLRKDWLLMEIKAGDA
ncbi:hypothetical protein SETIT_8G052100v2 [Setaria italica]|uniref:DUF1618 domain-containing protein n=2 Tax=Setaria italica TaxID=4555 RepID=A0A368S4F6_SETIT|nr:hypothetical protein SETIT_8G052100v2 [Setaria italica]